MRNAHINIVQRFKALLRTENSNVDLESLWHTLNFITFGEGDIPEDLRDQISFDKELRAVVLEGVCARVTRPEETRVELTQLVREYELGLSMQRLTAPLELPVQFELLTSDAHVTFGPSLVLNSTLSFEKHLRRLIVAFKPIKDQPSFILSNNENPLAIFDLVPKDARFLDGSNEIRSPLQKIHHQSSDLILDVSLDAFPSVNIEEFTKHFTDSTDPSFSSNEGKWFILTAAALPSWTVVKQTLPQFKSFKSWEALGVAYPMASYAVKYTSNKNASRGMELHSLRLLQSYILFNKEKNQARSNVVDLTRKIVHVTHEPSRQGMDIVLLLYKYLTELNKPSEDVISTVDVAFSVLAKLPQDHELRDRVILVQ